MVNGFFGQVMALVKDINRIFRHRQHRTTTHHQVGQHQVMVADNTVDLVDLFPGFVKKTIFIV